MDGLRLFLTNRLTWVSAAFVAGFVALAKVSPVSTLAEGVGTALVTLAFMGFVTYSAVAVRAYKAHRWPNEPLLAALAMTLMMAGMTFGGLFRILWRLSNFETFLVNNDVYTFMVALVAVGIFILISTPNLFGSDVPGWTRFRLGAAWVVAVTVIVGLTVLSPDLSWLAAELKPLLMEKPASAVNTDPGAR